MLNVLFCINMISYHYRGFNDAVNGFVDDGWTIMGSDGVEDVTIAINSSPSKFLGSHYNNLSMLPTFGGVLCARASMLLQVSYNLFFENDATLGNFPFPLSSRHLICFIAFDSISVLHSICRMCPLLCLFDS